MCRWLRLFALVTFAFFFVLALEGQAGYGDGTTERVSLSTLSAQGNDHSAQTLSISFDGRYVIFGSSASNLVPNDTNGMPDVFVHDRTLKTTERVSASTDGSQGNGYSGVAYGASISADGRFAVFTSSSSNLVEGDTSNTWDVFLFDRSTRTTRRVSEGNGAAGGVNGVINSQGTRIAFESSGLTPDDTDLESDIFLFDVQTGGLTLVSGDDSERSQCPSISDDGSRVAYRGASYGGWRVVVKNIETGQRTIADVSDSGALGNSLSWAPSLSGNGRYVSFTSASTNLVANDTNSANDVFVHDLLLRRTERISLDRSGNQLKYGGESNGVHESSSTLSSDGRFAIFTDFTGTLLGEGMRNQVFVRDRMLGSVHCVSSSESAPFSNGGAAYGAVSADGRFFAFTSDATNLVGDDTNEKTDTFVHQRGASFRLAVNPTIAPSQAFSLGTITLPSPAPPNGATFTITSSNIAVAVPLLGNQEASPLSLTVPGGSKSASFLIRTKVPPTATTVTFRAAIGSENLAVGLRVTTESWKLIGAPSLYKGSYPSESMNGIVCDNSVAIPIFARNKLGLRTPALGTIKKFGAYVTNAKGELTNEGEVLVENGALFYHPPLEYGSAAAPTRKVNVTTLFQTDTGWFITKPASIILARPVTVLVHGINNPPDVWYELPKQYKRRPWTAVDHFNGLQNGNAPVERGAMLLRGEIRSVLQNLNSGTFSVSRTYDPGSWYADDPPPEDYRFKEYEGLRLSSDRVDVVAWSYGGMIARWYLAAQAPIATDASGANENSLLWYRRKATEWWGIASYADYRKKLRDDLVADRLRYNNDVRKLITLGTMWRGVPTANWLNEILEVGGPADPPLAQAPANNSTRPLRDWLYDPPLLFSFLPPARVASTEVMAIGSPWLNWLIYRNPTGTGAPTPYNERVMYHAIAGDNNMYKAAADPYSLFDSLDQERWFPWLNLEIRKGSTKAFSDGIVPLWSQQIPGEASTIFGVDHNDYTWHQGVRQFVISLLDSPNLKAGGSLNAAWQAGGYVESNPRSNGRRFPWEFDSGNMAPKAQSAIYGRVGATDQDASTRGVGRIYSTTVRQWNKWLVNGHSRGNVEVSWYDMRPFSRIEIHRITPNGTTQIGAIDNPAAHGSMVIPLPSGKSFDLFLKLKYETRSDGQLEQQVLLLTPLRNVLVP